MPAGYSGTPLAKKLGIQPGHTVAIVNEPDGFRELLVALPDGVDLEGDLAGAWDGARLAQAFSNLISNALQHGKPDSPVKVNVHGTPEHVTYTVQNEANPIPPAKLRTLFDPVKRFAIRPAAERTAARTQNLGLGLYVVKEIITAHEGTISVRSDEADGVTFTVRLPRLEPHRRFND